MSYLISDAQGIIDKLSKLPPATMVVIETSDGAYNLVDNIKLDATEANNWFAIITLIKKR